MSKSRDDFPGVLAQQVTERQLQEVIRQAALYHKWLYYHTFDSRRSPSGFADCVLLRPPRLVIAELKAEGKVPTALQQRWLEDFRQVETIEVYTWRPTDLDTALAVLR